MRSDLLTSTFLRFRDQLHRLASGIAGEKEADDVLHDAFCRLWAGVTPVKSETEAIKIVHTSVRNLAIDVWRRDKSHPSMSVDDNPAQYAGMDEDTYAKEQSEVYDSVLEISRKSLNEVQYKIFYLHDVNGVGYADLAEEMGMTPENVRMTLSRARKIIREIYRKINRD